MNKLIALVPISLALTACISKTPMTSEAAKSIGRIYAYAETCLATNQISMSTYADAKLTAEYAKTTWSKVDTQEIQNTYEVYSVFEPSRKDCADLLLAISQANTHRTDARHQADSNAQAWRDLNQQLQQSRPTNCFTTGTGSYATTTCY